MFKFSCKIIIGTLYFIFAEDAPRIVIDEKEAKKQRMEKKRQLKLKFDTNYDGDETGGKAHYEELKKEVDTQSTVRWINILEWES